MDGKDRYDVVCDICGRIPHGVAVRVFGDWFEDEREPYDAWLSADSADTGNFITYFWNDRLVLKPYLRPMSDLTFAEQDTLRSLETRNLLEEYDRKIRYLNSIHADFRGLIKRGLALEAPNGMYTKKNR